MADADVFLAKAAESLASAEADVAAGRFNACARNAYYAAFQAAVAALMNEGIHVRGRWSHEYVQSQFAGILVYRRKLYPARMRSDIAKAMELRLEADYSEKLVGRGAASATLQFARGIVGLVREKSHGYD